MYIHIHVMNFCIGTPACNTLNSQPFYLLKADSPKADVSELRDARLQAEEEVATHEEQGIHWDAGLNRYTKHPDSDHLDVRV